MFVTSVEKNPLTWKIDNFGKSCSLLSFPESEIVPVKQGIALSNTIQYNTIQCVAVWYFGAGILQSLAYNSNAP